MVLGNQFQEFMYTRQLHFIPSPVFFPSTGDGTKDLSLTLEANYLSGQPWEETLLFPFPGWETGLGGKGRTQSVASYSGFTRVQVQPGART